MPPYLYWSDKVWVVGYYSYSVLKFLFWLMNSAWGIWFMDTHQIWRELKRPFRIFKNLPFLWNCFIDLKCYWSIPMSKLSEDTNFIMINLFTTKHFWNIFLVLGHFWLFSSLYCHRKSPSEAIMSQTFSLVQSRGRLPSVQFSSVTQSCLTLCDPMNRSTPGLPVHHQLLEFLQTSVHWIWCHPAISSSAIPFSSCVQFFPTSGSFQMSPLFTSGGPLRLCLIFCPLCLWTQHFYS